MLLRIAYGAGFWLFILFLDSLIWGYMGVDRGWRLWALPTLFLTLIPIQNPLWFPLIMAGAFLAGFIVDVLTTLTTAQMASAGFCALAFLLWQLTVPVQPVRRAGQIVWKRLNLLWLTLNMTYALGLFFLSRWDVGTFPWVRDLLLSLTLSLTLQIPLLWWVKRRMLCLPRE